MRVSEHDWTMLKCTTCVPLLEDCEFSGWRTLEPCLPCPAWACVVVRTSLQHVQCVVHSARELSQPFLHGTGVRTQTTYAHNNPIADLSTSHCLECDQIGLDRVMAR